MTAAIIFAAALISLAIFAAAARLERGIAGELRAIHEEQREDEAARGRLLNVAAFDARGRTR